MTDDLNEEVGDFFDDAVPRTGPNGEAGDFGTYTAPDRPRYINPAKLSKQAIQNDTWDREDAEAMLKEMREFRSERDRLTAVIETGDSLWKDAFWALLKASPKLVDEEEVRPLYRIDGAVMGEAMEIKEYHELRAMGAEGDDIQAAMGTINLRPELEVIYDKLKKEQDLAKQLDNLLQELFQNMLEQDQLDGDDPLVPGLTIDGPDGAVPGRQSDATRICEGMGSLTGQAGTEAGAKARDLQQKRDLLERDRKALEAAKEKAEKDLADGIEQHKPEIREGLKQSLGRAVKEAKDLRDGAEFWGYEPGQIMQMDAKERMDLARKLREQGARLRRMAELFGRIKNLAFGEQRKKVNKVPEEVYDVGIGGELDRVLPSEYPDLDDEMMELEFMARLADEELLSYKMRGTEKLAKGGIIWVEDGSGSMRGDREIWAKAVGLCLLHLAKQQKRSFTAIHFGAATQCEIFNFDRPEDFKPEKIIAFTELFFNGGTNFERPLNEALAILEKEFATGGCVKGDVVFATDGTCGVADDWFANFKERQAALQFRVFGVAIGCDRTDEPLAKICDGRVVEVADLTGGDDMKDIFGEL